MSVFMNEELTLLPLATAAPFKSCRGPQQIRLLFIALALFWASGGSTLLRASEIHQAAREGDLSKVLLLLRGNPDLVHDLTADDRSTPLHEAVRGGHIEIVRAIIAAKSEVNAKTSYGYSPLKMAKIYRRTEIASLLEANGGQMLEPPPKPRTWVVPTTQLPQRASMPRYRSVLRGDKELRIINNSRRTVSVRILSGDAGTDLYIAPGSSRSANMPTGNFALYYIFSDEPWTLYKGDNVWLSSNIASGSITIGASHGNYSIRQVN